MCNTMHTEQSTYNTKPYIIHVKSGGQIVVFNPSLKCGVSWPPWSRACAIYGGFMTHRVYQHTRICVLVLGRELLFHVLSLIDNRIQASWRNLTASNSNRKRCTLCRRKVPTFKLSVTVSNLNRFSQLLHHWKAYKICYKIQHPFDISRGV